MKNELFASRLKELRKEKQITQKALASDIGVSLSSIINYENAQRFPVSAVISLLSNYFEVSKEYLLGESNVRLPMGSWEDSNDISEIMENFPSLLNKIFTGAKDCSEFEQKMLFDILVELRHVVNLKDDDAAKRSETLSFIQDTIARSNRLIKVLNTTSSSTSKK